MDTVVDFGGGLGGTYINNRDLLPLPVNYIVVEQSNFVQAGQTLCRSYHLPITFATCLNAIPTKPKLLILFFCPSVFT